MDVACWLVLRGGSVGSFAWYGGRLSVGLPSLGACALVWWHPMPSGGSSSLGVRRVSQDWLVCPPRFGFFLYCVCSLSVHVSSPVAGVVPLSCFLP